MLLFKPGEYLLTDNVLTSAQENVWLIVTGLFFTSWGLWRLWKFTILPRVYPDDPKELPYWIPGKVSRLMLLCLFNGYTC